MLCNHWSLFVINNISKNKYLTILYIYIYYIILYFIFYLIYLYQIKG